MSNGPSCALDASALLAFIFNEPGADVVERAVAERAVISAVNWAEALTKVADVGRSPEQLAEQLTALLGDALEIAPLTAQDGPAIALLRPLTRDLGLSLADRACLALAHRLKLPALTTDRAWAQLDLDVTVQLARP